jgi:Ca2+:H+ antiporter
MKKFFSYFKNNPLSLLLIGFPLAIGAELAGWNQTWVFIFSATAVIPLAGYIGEATEALAAYTGPRVGALLNATLGNAAELIITLMAIKAGLLDLVKASITGSIIGNLLLVMGFSMVAGGVKNGYQTFDRRQSSNQAILLILAVLALAIPTFFASGIGIEGSSEIETLSLSVAVVMIFLYGLGILFSLKTTASPITYPSSADISIKPHWSLIKAMIVLALATVGVVWMSELLVGAVETVTESLGLSEFFLGIILVPIVGNVAEHLVAVRVALKNDMNLSIDIALSSSLQIALFVAPLLVFISLWMGHPLTLIFNPFELVSLGAAAIILALVSADGESNWLEGAALLAVYLILSISFFMLPA